MSATRRTPEWITILGLIAVVALGVGTSWYAMGMLMGPLTQAFDWSRGDYSLATTLYMLFLFLSATPVGWLVDRFGSRRVMTVAAVANGTIWLLMSQLGRLGLGDSPAQIYPLYAAMGFASVSLGGVPASALVVRAFGNRRGLAMGLSAVGAGLPGITLVPLSAWLMTVIGWRGLAGMIAALELCVALPVALWALKGVAAEAQAASAPRGEQKKGQVGAVLRNPTFWGIGLAILLSYSGGSAVQVHAVPFLTDRGLSTSTASLIWGSLAFAGIVGKVSLGWLADRLSARWVMFLAAVLQGSAVALVLILPGEGAAWAFALIFGVGMAGQYLSLPLITAERFDLKHYGTVYGLLSLFGVPGMAGSQAFAGMLYDRTGGYLLPFGVFVGVWVLGALLLLALGRGDRADSDA